jgi:hypothetical protein
MHCGKSLRCWSALGVPEPRCMLQSADWLRQPCMAHRHRSVQLQRLALGWSGMHAQRASAHAAATAGPAVLKQQPAAEKHAASPQRRRVMTVDYTTLLACTSGIETPARIEQVRTACLQYD